MTAPRTIVWFSTGAASAVAARMIPEAILVRCETGAEDEDNHRFEADVCAWLGRSVTVLQSEKYASVDEVWEDRRYMSGIHGAPCTGEMLAPACDFLCHIAEMDMTPRPALDPSPLSLREA